MHLEKYKNSKKLGEKNTLCKFEKFKKLKKLEDKNIEYKIQRC